METATRLALITDTDSSYERPIATVESILDRIDDITDAVEFGDEEPKRTIHGYVGSDAEPEDQQRINITVYNHDFQHGPRKDFLVARICKRADMERDKTNRMVVYVLAFDGISKELSLKQVKKIKRTSGIKKIDIPCDQSQLEVVAHMLGNFIPIEE